MRAVVLCVATLVAVSGCHRSLMVSRPADPKLDAAYTETFWRELGDNVREGDIVLRRGYAVLSDVIVAVTWGPEMSHAGIYDATTGTVIEAVDGGVTERNLWDYVRGAHQVIVVRPDRSGRERHDAVVRARSRMGVPFDYLGFVGAAVGVQDPDRFYCSELVAWALEARADELELDGLVAPSELVALGQVVYDSGARGGRPLAMVDAYWRP